MQPPENRGSTILTLSASDPFAAALRLLARTERSSYDLADRLRKKGFDSAAIEAALERCRAFGYLDDTRFARSRARSLVQSGRAVGGRLLADLSRHGIDPETAQAAFDEARGDRDERALLSELAERRFPEFSWLTADDRSRRRVVQYFLRRGFSLSLVLTFFQQER